MALSECEALIIDRVHYNQLKTNKVDKAQENILNRLKQTFKKIRTADF